MYMVEFSGNGHSDMATVIRFWNRRANELCPNGFALLEQNEHVTHVTSKTDIPVAPGLFVPYIHNFVTPTVSGKIKCK